MNIHALTYFAIHKAIGSRVQQNYEEMLRLERSTVRDLVAVQSERIEKLLAHAVKHVPYYRDRIKPRGSLALSDFPILTKVDIRKHFQELMTPEVSMEFQDGRRRRGYSWVKVQTGGTTGMPTTVVHDVEYRDRGRAGRLYSLYLCGFPLGTPYFRLWGNMRDINEMRDSRPQRILRLLHRETLFNAFRMDEERMKGYIRTMSRSSARHLMGYVDAVAHLAKYARASGLKIRPLESVMACAGNVTDGTRELIKNVCGARVHNQYGSRDCAGIACECEFGGHHIHATNVFIEIVSEDGREVATGNPGRILVTLFHNFAFPLIRYEIGDVGALSDESCCCGRVFPLLKSVEGRTVEFLRSIEGAYVSPVYVRHLIGVVHNDGLIKRFQLEQNSAEEFELRCELENGRSSVDARNAFDCIDRDLKAVLGSGAQIRISCVPEIPLTASGKFLYVVNHLASAAK